MQQQRKTAPKPTAPRRPSDAAHKKTARSASSESSTSTESSAGSSSAIRSTGAAYTTEEVKQKYLARGSIDGTSDSGRSRAPSVGSKDAQKPFQSRFLNKSTPPPPKEDETESTTEEETETEEESDENAATVESKEMAKTDIGPLLARSAQARDNSEPKRETPTSSSYGRSRLVGARRAVPRNNADFELTRYGAQKEESPVSKYASGARSRPVQHDDEQPRYGYTSRFLNKSKSSATVPPDEEEHNDPAESKYPRSRYAALKDRRQRLARSRSSHAFPDDDDVDEPISPTSSNPTAYLASRGYGTGGGDLSRSRSTHALKSRESSPDRPSGAAAEKDGAALSSWARYLKSKYGNRGGGGGAAKDKETASSSSAAAASSSAPANSATARRLSLGLPLRSSADLGSSDDDQKNMQGSPTTPTAVMAAAGRFQKTQRHQRH